MSAKTMDDFTREKSIKFTHEKGETRAVIFSSRAGGYLGIVVYSGSHLIGAKMDLFTDVRHFVSASAEDTENPCTRWIKENISETFETEEYSI